MKVEKVLSLKSKAEIKLNNLKNDLLRQQKEGISGFVVSSSVSCGVCQLSNLENICLINSFDLFLASS